MGELMYYVISTSADGVHIEEFSKEGLEETLAEDGYVGQSNIMAALPKDGDPNYWGNSLVIIKGEVVMPKPIQVVKRFELP